MEGGIGATGGGQVEAPELDGRGEAAAAKPS